MAEPTSPLSFVFLADPASPHTTRWIDGLTARGHRVALISSKASGPGWLRRVRAWIARYRRLRRLSRARDAVVVVQYVPAGIQATALLGVHPRIGVAWGSDIYMTTSATPRLAVAAMQQWLFLRGCDAVLTPSTDLGRAAAAAGARPDRIVTVPFGVDLDRFRPGMEPSSLRSRLHLDGYRVVLSNRTIAPIYHQRTVVEALGMLPADVVVVMTRHLARPAELAAVERHAAALGVSARLRIVDPVTEAELPDLYRLAAVVVSLAGSDGGPVTILEAMATGKQIVATDIPGVREWLLDIDPEALVPIGDATATGLALRRALERPTHQRDAIAECERARVRERGDREWALRAMEELHHAVLCRPPPRPLAGALEVARARFTPRD